MTRWMSLTPNGVLHEYDDEPTLKRLQDEVGGYIEAVASPDPALRVSLFVCDEKVSLEGTPLAGNAKATAFLVRSLWPGQRIVGPLVLCGEPDEEGELTNLTDEQVAKIKETFG